MGMISARFCVYNKQGTPNDVANLEKYVKIVPKWYIIFFEKQFIHFRIISARLHYNLFYIKLLTLTAFRQLGLATFKI